MLVGSIFQWSDYVFDFVVVVLPLGICPGLTPEDREVMRRLGKCCPRAYSYLIRLDVPGSSGVSPSSSSCSRSPPLPTMETPPGGSLIVKLTRGEFWTLVKL